MVAQCMFGLSDPESGKWHRKRTRLDTKHPQFTERLEVSSQCSHSAEEREPILGSTHLHDGPAFPRSTWASRFTPSLAQHILHCARDALDAGWEEKGALAVNSDRGMQSAHTHKEQGRETGLGFVCRDRKSKGFVKVL